MKHRFAFAAATVLLIACGSSKGPPPKATEESIDKDPPSPQSHVLPPVIHDDDDTMGPPGGTGKEVAAPADPPDDTSMKTVAGATAVTAPTTPSKPTGKGPLLSKGECDKLFGKLIDITMVEQGIDPKQAGDARAMMKTAAQADPAMAGFQNSCVTTLKKSNYTCAMSAKTSVAYQNCLK